MKRMALVVLTLALLGSVLAAQDLERLFKAAVNTETVDRNCKAAIEQYKKVAAGSNRALAAQALLRMAGCYQNLGDAQARTTYERVVREFADQQDALLIARSRLAVRPLTPPVGDRVVKAGPLVTWGDGRVSPDGRFISHVSYAGPKGLNLMLHDLLTNTDRAITDVDWNGGSAYDSTFSPDGKQLAYGWSTYVPPDPRQLRIVTLDGTGMPRPPRTIYASADTALAPTDWSPDGKAIAVRVARPDGTKQIGVIGLDGSLRVLRTVDIWRAVNKIFFSPDGKYLAYDAPVSDTDQRRDLFIIAVDGSGETPIYDPADDVVMGWTPDGRLLFASDRSGQIDLWALPLTSGKPTATSPLLIKANIGTVDSQGLTAAGALYTVKSASTVTLQIAPIDLSAGKLAGRPVLQIFRTETPPAWSRQGNVLAYSARGANGQLHLAVRSMDSNRVRELRPPFVYMPDLQWFEDGGSIMISGRDTKGRLRSGRVDAETGQELPLPAAGQLSRDGKKAYVVTSQDSVTRSGTVFEQDLASGTKREVFRKPYATGSLQISPNGQWLAVVRTPSLDSSNPSGKTSTVFVVPAAGGPLREISVPAELEAYRGMDWTPDGQALLIAATAPEARLWLVPATGASPKKLDIDTTSWLTGNGIRLHPNGRQIAYFTGQETREVWVLERVAAIASK